MWVVLGHTVIWPLLSIQYDNSSIIMPPKGRLTELWFQIVPGGYFAVDTFFWLSGFLGTRVLTAKVRRSPRLLTAKGFLCQLYPVSILSRWLRLSLVYAFIFVVTQTWYAELGRGSLLWNAQMNGSRMGCAASIDNDTCKQYWWANMLYINNMVPVSSDADAASGGCLAHTWYLACDMQLFLLVPLLVLLRERAGRAVGYAVVAALTLASIVANAYVIDRDHLVTDPLFGNIGGSKFMQKIYEVSWMRAQPYLIGVASAWLLDSLLQARSLRPLPGAGALLPVSSTALARTLLQSGGGGGSQIGSQLANNGCSVDTEGLDIGIGGRKLSGMDDNGRGTGPVPLLAAHRGQEEEEGGAAAEAAECPGWRRLSWAMAWPAAALVLQLVSFALMCLVVFLPVTRYRCKSLLDCTNVHTSPWPEWLNVVYGATNHAVWAVGLACLMLLCFLRAPGTWWINTLLGNELWQRPMKLTYTAYLVHPLVLVYFYCQSDTSLHYLDVTLLCNFAAFCLFVFLAAFLLWVLVEKPAANLTARLLGALGVGGGAGDA